MPYSPAAAGRGHPTAQGLLQVCAAPAGPMAGARSKQQQQRAARRLVAVAVRAMEHRHGMAAALGDGHADQPRTAADDHGGSSVFDFS